MPDHVQRPPCVRLWVLGPFKADRDGIEIPDSAWQRPKARALIKLLAVRAGHRLHQEEILDLLWPDLDRPSALGSLRKATTLARQALEPDLPARSPSAYLNLTDGVLGLCPETVWIDADEFQRQAEAALGNRDDLKMCKAFALYRDDLLPEDQYEDWAQRRREELAHLHQQLLLDQAELLERQGKVPEATSALLRVLRRQPEREDLHRRLMRLYMVAGNRRHALRQYQLCQDALKHEMGVEPEPETLALYEEIASSRLSPSPSLSATSKGVETPSLPRAIRRLPETAFIGRDRALQLVETELARARQLLAKGRQEHRSVVLIGGEAGVGKTRLAAEVARAAASHGTLVLWGGNYHQEGVTPYAPFIEAIDEFLSHRSLAERQGLAASYPELTSLLPGLSAAAGSTAERSRGRFEGEAGRLQLSAAIVRLLTEVTEGSSLLLVLDDLHAADEATVGLLHQLARVVPGHPWLIVGTYREEDVRSDSTFERVRASLNRAALCRHVDLLRLSRADCAALVASLLPGGMPGDELLDGIYLLSMGNPLFAQQLVLSMHDDLKLHNGMWTASTATPVVPPQVRDLILERVGRLSNTTQQVLSLAAVAGMECDLAVLRLATSLDEKSLLDALDDALTTRILEERGTGFAFRHPLLRKTLYDRLSQTRRSYLHTLLGQTIEALSPDAVDAPASHFTRNTDDEKAIRYLKRPTDRASSVHAIEEASTHHISVEDGEKRYGRKSRGH